MAFLKLHKQGKASEKGYWINGGKFKIGVFGIVPFVLLLVALFFTLFPEFNVEMFEYNWPLIVGACIAVLAGEVLVWNMGRKDQKAVTTKREVTNEN